ncbi:MAG: SiaB family protein kinase [Bacteroidota bacterium]|nr:SiaB family protein kinase [Bacteroidota bacterium]
MDNRMLDRIHDLYDELERHRVMLSFKGNLTAELVGALLEAVERKMNGIEPDPRSRKRVFNVVMECLQNLFHHNSQMINADPTLSSPKGEPHGVVMIAHVDKGYSIVTGNFMAGSDVEKLKGHLDKINGMNADELRDFYKETLAEGKFSSKGGGGLGMIDIARKSGCKLEYGFVPYDQENAFFSLNVNVSNRPDTK